MDGWGSAAIKYCRAHRAGIVWGDWLRHGRPKHTTCFRCTLANPERIGDSSTDHVPFMAYGTEADNYTALLFEGIYEQQTRAIKEHLLWFYARYEKFGASKPLLSWPDVKRNAGGEPLYWSWHPRAGQVMDDDHRDMPGAPIIRVTDYCVWMGITRARFFTRLNKALYDVELEMVDRDRDEPLAPVMTDAQRLKLRA